jgi:hypothetical protein
MIAKLRKHNIPVLVTDNVQSVKEWVYELTKEKEGDI